MSRNFKFSLIILVIGVDLLFLYYQLIHWKIAWVGWGLFVLYILLVGHWWTEIFGRVYGFNRGRVTTKILGWFAAFTLLGLVSSVFVVLHRLTPMFVWVAYVAGAVVAAGVFWLIGRTGHRGHMAEKEGRAERVIVFGGRWILAVLYGVLWLAGFWLLVGSRSDAALFSPWQAIHPYFLPIFFALIVLLGIMLFSRFRTSTLLFFIIAQSFLLHFYLPLSHELPWGGDVWRHVANEERLSQGEFIYPVAVGPNVETRNAGGFDIPEVFVHPQKFSYGHLWGASVALAHTLGADFIQINKWLVPIVWSLIIPILLFRIGLLLFGSPQRGLWLAALTFVAFPLQALGGLTLPVSLGFPVFLLALLLWLIYLRDGDPRQKWVALVLAGLLAFGYALYFLLMWIMIAGSWILKKILNIKYSILKNIASVVLFIAVILVIPVIELAGNVSRIPSPIDWIGNAKQLLGQFSGWYFASAIRPHDIVSGNILFNHTPEYTFVPNLFADWQWHVVVVVGLIWLFAFIGFFRKKVNMLWSIMTVLFSTVFGGYVIGWFVLEGDRLLTRRLDATLAFVLLVFFLFGIFHVSRITYHVSRRIGKVSIFLMVLVFSWFATTTYASGPDIRVVSRDEYDAAQYIWDQEDHTREKYCVLADTWLLLALEGISGGRIVGGGFPIDAQFGQPERVQLLDEMNKNPSEGVLQNAHQLTFADNCWVALEEGFFDFGVDRIDEIIGSTAKPFGYESTYLLVWREGLKNVEE